MSTDITRYLAELQYRALNPLQKAVALVCNGVCSSYQAAAACGVSQSAVARGRKAAKEGRDVGIIGKPRIFSDEDSEKILEDIENKAIGMNKPTYKKTKAIVSRKINQLRPTTT